MTIYHYKYRILSEALYDSLFADPFYATLEGTIKGNPEDKKKAMLRYMDYSMREGEKFGKTYFQPAHAYGVSIWLKPLSRKKEIEKKAMKKEFLLTQVGHHAWRCYASIVDHMTSKLNILISSQAWYLSIVGLSPGYQNRGFGSGLIIPVLEMLDKKEIMTYLETFTPRNIKFYEKLGYVIVDSVNEPTTGADYWIMVRKPILK